MSPHQPDPAGHGPDRDEPELDPVDGLELDDQHPTGALGEFEQALARALEQRALAAAARGGPPNAEERAALARMAAHLAEHPLRGATPAPPREQGPPSWPRRRRGQVVAQVAAAAAAAAALFVAVRPGTTEKPRTDLYLGDPAEGEPVPFPGTVSWDDGGDGGLVRVRVFDLDGDPRVAVLDFETAETTFTPTGALPQRFLLQVSRPADNGIDTEDLLWRKFAAR